VALSDNCNVFGRGEVRHAQGAEAMTASARQVSVFS
jgi:hypothetical protein